MFLQRTCRLAAFWVPLPLFCRFRQHVPSLRCSVGPKVGHTSILKVSYHQAFLVQSGGGGDERGAAGGAGHPGVLFTGWGERLYIKG